MDHLLCKACGAHAVHPLPVELHREDAEDDILSLEDRESRFFTCQICGDNWLTVREVEAGSCTITFVHQMGMTPALKRVAAMQTPVIMSSDTVEAWDYFLDDEAVDESAWFDKLDSRRQLLRSMSLN